MKRLLLAAVLLVLTVGAYWAGSRSARQTGASHASQTGRTVLYYVDPMNPAHTSDKPGKAPCGMDMEPVYADSVDVGMVGAGGLAAGTVKVAPEKQQLIGVRVQPVESKVLQSTLRLLGKVATDETRIYRINATVDGWITRALPVAPGSPVKKDQTLAEFYSPEFLAAAQAMLYALSSADRAKPTGQETQAQRSQMANFEINLKQYRDALRNLGMGELQIQELIRTRQRMENVNITSPSDGFILVRNVSDGQRFDKGTELFRIADLSRVWILVDVFERDVTLLNSDQAVKIELPAQAKTFSATVSKSLPQFDNISRTLKLRLEADNPDFALKPDMFVDVELPLKLAEAVVIPSEAVLDAGLRQTVFVDRGNGYFEPRRVYLGARVGDQVQVTQGLAAGERVVVSGNFLLDSESRMKLAAAGVHSTAVTDPVCGMSVDETKARAGKRVSEVNGITYFFCNDACKAEFDKNPPQYTGPKNSTAGADAKSVDPVCGMKVSEAKARAAGRMVSYGGKTYYFCNDSCKEEFVADAKKYVKDNPSH